MVCGRAAVILIRAYQIFISPLLGAHCRFQPTCSQYAIDSYEKHGFLKGTILAFLRLVRCGPWHEGGFDPVPDDASWKNLFHRRG